MIIITGAAGFIGSCMVAKLNSMGFKELILVDDFSNLEKNKNLANKEYKAMVERDIFFDWAKENEKQIQMILHIGARTDTTENNMEVFDKLNLNYSKSIWQLCAAHDIPLIYASSAATYGLGEKGYDDDHGLIPKLKPLNAYAVSKNEFDIWALKQEMKPFFWAGFKFFNVYGPNEYHKGRMASVIFHAYNQLQKNNYINLFKSHNPKYEDGGQMRDFIYVKDVCDVLYWFMINRKHSGIYNLGTGKAETFEQLALSTIEATNPDGEIHYIDTPEDIREKYQYYTCANMNKIILAGYDTPFYSLQNGIEDYIQNYLQTGNYL